MVKEWDKSGYITHAIGKTDSKLMCEDCNKKKPIFVWQYKINLFGPLQTTWWLCTECYKKRVNEFIKEVLKEHLNEN